MEGILNILKPPGMTSHDVINWVRKTLKEKKVGHIGTLDPGAGGVLPVFIGKATKIIPYINEDRKIYRAKINFGITTDTQDQFGQILQRRNPNFNLAKLNVILNTFIGEIEQKPSIYSAIKVKGKKLYEYARENKPVDIPMRKVSIYNIRIIYHNIPNSVFIEIECSKGTYIRTLCSDIGECLGCGAHMGFLLRIHSGIFNISTAYTLEEIENYYNNGRVKDIFLPIDVALRNYPKILIKESAIRSLKNGNSIYPQGIRSDLQSYSVGNFVIAYINNQLSAIGKIQFDEENHRYCFKPSRVLL